jgi:hypothetical protein
MSKRYNDIDEIVKDVAGPESKFYKDWMKSKVKRDAYINGWMTQLKKKIKEETDENNDSQDRRGRGRKRNSANSGRNNKKPRVERKR